jgi:hypothetical protein
MLPARKVQPISCGSVYYVRHLGATRDLFWPDLSVDTSAESACDTASYACFAIAGLTTIFVLLHGLVDFGGCAAVRAHRVRTTQEVADRGDHGFLLYLLETVTWMAAGRGGQKSSRCSTERRGKPAMGKFQVFDCQ